MPRAKTGCDHVLYTTVTKEGLQLLNTMVEKAGDGVSRPLFVDTMIKRMARQPKLRVKVPKYVPHKRTVRKILKTA